MKAAAYRPERGEVSEAVLLMCPPDYYGVEYEINPWMDRNRPVDQARASEQWNALRRTLEEEVRATIETAPPVPGLPDFVFTANAGLVVDGAFIPSRFRYPQRAREERHWRTWIAAQGFRVLDLPSGLHFEGEGDAFLRGDLLVGGYRFRSDPEALHRVGELLGKRVLALELVDPWFYHLDTCFCPLDDGMALYFPQAFTEEGRRTLVEHFPGAVLVPEEEARHFACNSAVIGRHVVMSCDCPWTRAQLRARGYATHEVNVSEFLKAGGGAKCLVLFLKRAAAVVSGEVGAAHGGVNQSHSG